MDGVVCVAIQGNAPEVSTTFSIVTLYRICEDGERATVLVAKSTARVPRSSGDKEFLRNQCIIGHLLQHVRKRNGCAWNPSMIHCRAMLYSVEQQSLPS